MNRIIYLIFAVILLTCNQQQIGENMVEEQPTSEQKMHHYMGIEMNMQSWNLLTQENRTPEDDARMVYFAHASLYHWKLSPQFQPVNEQRGEWMIAHVFAVLGHGERALEHAEKCWKLTEEHGFQDFDLAYAYECLARSYAAIKSAENVRKYYNLAKQVGEKIAGEEDKKIFISDLTAEPWFGAIVD